jgi:hypothetical protein
MKRRTSTWLYGLLSALISGAGVGVSGSSMAAMIRPDAFNLADGVRDMAKLAIGLAVAGAITGVSNYLKQSPLPPSASPSATKEPQQ